MPPLSHLLFHFLELGPQAVASGLPLKKESAVAACAANEGKQFGRFAANEAL